MNLFFLGFEKITEGEPGYTIWEYMIEKRN